MAVIMTDVITSDSVASVSLAGMIVRSVAVIPAIGASNVTWPWNPTVPL